MLQRLHCSERSPWIFGSSSSRAPRRSTGRSSRRTGDSPPPACAPAHHRSTRGRDLHAPPKLFPVVMVHLLPRINNPGELLIIVKKLTRRMTLASSSLPPCTCLRQISSTNSFSIWKWALVESSANSKSISSTFLFITLGTVRWKFILHYGTNGYLIHVANGESWKRYVRYWHWRRIEWNKHGTSHILLEDLKKGFLHCTINVNSIFDVLILQTISWSPQQSMIVLQKRSRRPFQP